MSVYILVEKVIPLQLGGGFRPIVTIKGVYATLELAQAVIAPHYGWSHPQATVWNAGVFIQSLTDAQFEIHEFEVNT